ncbi:MFS transporter [Actinokineospora sp.]|uniref:MFS transporter n=1 Tax=Actinokineospora sp. TaxID=1872133 RepID=UPI004037A40A
MSTTEQERMIEVSTQDGEPQAPSRRWVALAIVTIAAFIDNLDSTVVTLALPSIQADLAADFATAQWTLAGYTLAFALMLITGGRLGDIYGRRRLFLVGVAGFTAASIACGAAGTPELLIAGRVAQGLAAALMVPQVVSVIVTLFEQHEWPKAFGVLGLALTSGAVIGPAVGGAITEADILGLGWRAIFYLNVPIGVLGLVMATRYLPESRSPRAPRVDGPGMVLLALATLALMFPLVQGREYGWPWWMFALLATSVPLLFCFAAYQVRRHRRDGSALIPPPLFRQRSFSVGLLITLLMFIGVGSFFLVLTYHLQLGLGWSPLHTALATAAWPLGIATTFQIAWRMGAGRGRLFVRIGAGTMAAGTLLTIVMVDAAGAGLSWWHIGLPSLVLGLGMGLTSPILTGVVLGDVPVADAGAGSGVVNAVIQFGSATGVAFVGTIFFSMTGSAVSDVDAATTTTLWYNVGVFVLAVLLTSLLPAGRSAESTPEAEQVDLLKTESVS